MQRSTTAVKPNIRLVVLLAAVVALFLGSFPLGRFPIPIDAVVGILGSKLIAIPQTWTDTMEAIVLQVRLPRILAALLVGAGSTIVLVLGGLVVSTLFQALISTLQYLANPVDTLPTITFWLMGSLAKVTMRDVLFAAIPVGVWQTLPRRSRSATASRQTRRWGRSSRRGSWTG